MEVDGRHGAPSAEALSAHSAEMLLQTAYAAAEALYQQAQWRAAIDAYREIVAAHPLEVRAWALMGLCATQAGELTAAAHALQQAATLEPSAANVHFRLGIVLHYQGRPAEAEAAFQRTLALDPSNVDAQQNLAAVLMDQGRPREAQPLFESIVEKHPEFELAWAGLANIHAIAGDRENQIACLQRAIAINPANVATQHLLSAAKGETPPHPDWRYVENFFDDYAGRFESHLVGRLDYVAPAYLMEMIGRVQPQTNISDVLDLGCGTGLLGAAVRGVYSDARMIGVDLSQRMVQSAQARGIYADVEKAEAEAYLRGATSTFDLIAATDVFIYVGDVSELFVCAYERLAPGGLLAFTVETTRVAQFELQPTGRYAHNAADLRALARRAHFEVLAEETAPLRRHAGKVEEGLYVVLRRPFTQP